ncbi:MAG TPA: HEAT repeat domain-containing protein [Vicinamibacteria bacterium]|nr:HEAT repeat domain-containing protein [Vicinamibacteria bacterium]
MTRRAALFALLFAAAVPAAAAPPPNVQNAPVKAHDAAGNLQAVFDRLVAGASAPTWIGYAVPVLGSHQMCCWSSTEGIGRDCPGCRLEGGGAFTVNASGARTVNLEDDRSVLVLFRVENGVVQRVRALSWSCGIDAGGRPLHWIDNADGGQSLRLLGGLVGKGIPSHKNEGGDGDSVVAAIAFHDHPDADRFLEALTGTGHPLRTRKQAVFWLGNARGERGLPTLARIARQDAEPKLREHAVFALSQSEAEGAVDVMLQVAREDASAHVRGQALFWLGQKAGRKATEGIERAMADDPEAEVRKKAVFALSQLPRDEGVPLLIRTARNHRDPAVRKQAIFWLGQSQDARALQFFAEVLGR